MGQLKIKIYLAGGLGFSELGQYSNEMFKNRIGTDFILIDPFEESTELGEKIGVIENNDEITLSEAKRKLLSINLEIGKMNETLIKGSDIILANLDGPDVDSGTASEIGFAYALGKKVLGYRGDFRSSGDNLGSKVNLQVEYFIKASGGRIFNEIEELNSFLEGMNKN